ncbi:MAG: hypothetical protein V3V21_05290 [Thermoplasmata archaeon]
MSHTVIFKVPESGPIERFREFHNSYLGAPLIWNHLGRKYLRTHWSFINNADTEALWTLQNDPRLADYERLALLSTFDNAMLRREYFELMADALFAIAEEKSAPRPGHLVEQAITFRAMLADEECYAACWIQTSVVADPWHRYDACPTCGQNEDVVRMFDLSRDDGHWFIDPNKHAK